MEARIQKWGNSDGIRIPSKKKKISLADRFKSYKGKNLAKDFVWDESVGKEIW